MGIGRKNYASLVFTVLVSLILLQISGCAFLRKEPEVITQTRLLAIKIPKSMYNGCEATPPPNREYYLKGDLDYRLGSMLRYNTQLLGDVKQCKEVINSIRKWSEQQDKIINTKNKK